MSFTRNTYTRLPTSKFGCAETDEDCGVQQINQNDEEDEDIAGYSLDFAEPKDSFVGQIKRSCEITRRKLMAVLHIILKFAFGKWPVALSILICYICLTIALTVIALTGKYHEFRTDLSLNSFMVPDIKVSNDFAAFNAAKDQRNSQSPSFETFMKKKLCTGNTINPSSKEEHRRLKRSTFYTYPQTKISGTLDLVYVAKDGENIFTPERLQEIHNIETTLMAHTNYDKHCLIVSQSKKDKATGKYGNCAPFKSLTLFFFREKDKLNFDGQSEAAETRIEETLQFLRSKKYFYSFVSDDFSEKNVSKILRAQILFGKPVQGISSEPEAQKEEYKRYITTYVSTLEKLNNNNQVTILYGGGDLFDYLVNHALLDDLRLAAISLGLIILLLLILTFSWWLSFMAVFTIVSSVAFAYFFYRVVFGIQYMGILNGVSLFVIIGIGVDDIFVFINTFRQAVDNKDVGNRIMHTIYVAGKATFFTSFTTAAAFGANALSPIPAIHDFGVFMAILVASCWVSVLFIMSPSLTLWHAGIEHLESAMCNKALSAIGIQRSERMRLPDDIRQFLSGIRSIESPEPEAESIPLMTRYNNNEVNNDDNDVDDVDDDDEPLLVLDDESTSSRNPTDPIGFRLQSILYYYLATPVIKGRIVVFCIYFFVLAGSALLMSKIKVSTEQPKFFKANSNLQRWLELPDISLKQSQKTMAEDIKIIAKRLSNHGRLTEPPSSETTGIPTRRVIKTREHSTSRPERPFTKPSTWLRSTRSPSTWIPTTKLRSTLLPTTRFTTTRFKPSTTRQRKSSTQSSHITTAARERTTEKRRTAEEHRTTTTDYKSTERPSTTHRAISEERGTSGWATTLPTNASNPGGCTPFSCKNYGKCNNVTRKCDCFFPYTGDTCSHYCPVRTMKGKCCFIPFQYKGKGQEGCLIDKISGKPWCSIKPIYEGLEDREECNTTVVTDFCPYRTNTPNMSCCSIPFTYNNIEYYTCKSEAGLEGRYCGIQPHVSSRDELVRCASFLCPPNECQAVKAPSNKATALVYLVFGVVGIDKTSVDLRHVLKQTEGRVLYNEAFSKDINCDTERLLKAACKICKAFSSNKKLVRAKDYSECFPKKVTMWLMQRYPHDCDDLPIPTQDVAHKSIFVVKKSTERSYEVQWLAMAFSSTTGILSSYSSQHKDYEQWENQLHEVLSQNDIPNSWKSAFQTSETWVKMFSGIIVVNSAIYGIAVSLLLCLAAVIIFTGHALLFIILLLTILGVLLVVTAIFYLTGWQLGGVEAISLSILVGTSVDYSFHLVEGYILAGNAVSSAVNNKYARQWRTKAAMSHIGMSIISSALTTILAAIPLCLTQIQLFAKFGLIVTINTGISLLYTLTVTMAMLSIFGPARFRAGFRACVIGFIVVLLLGGLGVLILYLLSTKGGYCIQSPSGTPLFDC